MNQKYLHHLWSTRIRPVRISLLIAACLVGFAISTIALRNNNLQMVKLRDAVYIADEKNDNVERALYNLRAHVYGHMNTDLATGENPVYPPIQLKYTYQRLVESEQKRVADASARIYSDAQTECERLYPDSFSGGPRVPCIEKYVSDHGVKSNKIPDSMYKFDFASPAWSPDFAGWMVAITIVLAILTVIRIGLGVLAR